MTGRDAPADAASRVHYRLVDPDEFEPEDHGHEPIGDGEYLAPAEDDHIEALDVWDVVDVIDWDYQSTDDVTLSGPPEPVIDEDGTIELITPTDDADPGGPSLRQVPLGKWICQRCGVPTEVPVEDEVEPPHQCSGCERQGPFEHAGGLSQEQAEMALRGPTMWDPPSSVSDEGYAALWDDVREYLHAHWDAGEGEEADAVYAGLTAYALSTWVRESLTFVPHLMLMGKTTGGKTRLLNTLARVSYRAVVTASATPASMFRLIDAYDVSYFISEYHGLGPDSRRELDNVVRAGQKRGEKVTRAEPTSTGHEPTVFDPFSHVAVATQYTPEDDIVNRCIQVRSSPPTREMPARHDEERAQALRNRLLYARFRLLESDEWREAEAEAFRYLAKKGIDGRTREKLLSLVTVAYIWDRMDALEPFLDEVVTQDREDAADSEDAIVIEAIRDLAFEEVSSTAVLGDGDPFASVEIPYDAIAERYEDMTGTEKTASWVGHVRDRLDLEKTRKSDGTVISDPDLGPKLEQLCEEHNLRWERLESHAPVEEMDETEQYRGACSECGGMAPLTHRDQEGYHVCRSCADEVAESA